MTRSVPALLLSLVYAAALAVALTDLGQHAVAGLLVLGGLTARFYLRHRRATAVPARHLAAVQEVVSAPAGIDAVLTGDVVPAAARAA